jgi:hypothetical protein
MQLNYLILAHKNLSQLDRLISALDHEQTKFFIHIDKKVPGREILNYRFLTNKNVTLLKSRIPVKWGGFSMVMATIKLLQAASAGNSGYYVLLSGEDFPLQPNANIHRFLSASYGKEYLYYAKLPYEGWHNGGMDRVDYYWMGDHIEPGISKIFLTFQKENLLKRPYFENFPPYGGSQWWCLTHECIQYILRFIRHNPVLIEYFKYTLCPDEVFFQTIIMNSPFKEQAINDNLKYIVYHGNANHPTLFEANDFSVLINSGKLWSRKFDITHDSVILDKIEAHLKCI